ncbi:MAG: ABC transporter substrate-binding protein [Chloroflexi bacterium]|nr:ABC transporter substrate-binding protein [Chloroflexota bacterium]
MNLLRGLVFLLSLAWLLACRAPPAPAPTPTATPTAAPIATATLPPALSPGPGKGRATLAAPSLSPNLDVHQEAGEPLLAMGPGIAYSRLLRLKTGPGAEQPSLAVECDLCEKWEQTSPTTYLFSLRPGVRWHDIPPVSGRELTAGDVAYSLDRLRTPGWPGAALLQALATVEAVNAGTVRVTLKYPDADFLLALAHGQSKIVAREAVEAKGDLRGGPTIGTGPWALDSAGDDGFRFRANEAYYEPGVPGLEALRVLPINDAGTRLALVASGQADIGVLDQKAWDNLKGLSASRVRRQAFPQPGTGLLLGLRADRPPFDRVQARQAFFLSLDPWKALADVWPGQGNVSVGVPAASKDWQLAQEEMRRFFADPGRAKALLAQAGAPKDFTLSLADFGDKYLALGDAYAAMMRQAGLRPTTETLNPRVYAEQVWGQRDFQAFLGPMPPVSSPNGFLLGMVHSQGQWAITGYADPELDRLAMEQSIAGEGRGELVLEIQRRLLDRAVLFMPMTGASLWVWGERVVDFTPNFAASEYFHWARIGVTGP